MRLTSRYLLPALAMACLSTPAMAAREFTPQAGLWMIPSENNGQPGRGFSLDVQGNTAFLQVFNYEKSGAATFHTAVGQLDDSASMTVPLLRFKGGRYLGGPPQIASEDEAAGNVTVKFSDGLNGTIQFPGEDIQPIARLLVKEPQSCWMDSNADSEQTGVKPFRSMRWITEEADGTKHVWSAGQYMEKDRSIRLETDNFTNINYSGDPFARQSFTCNRDEMTDVFDCLAEAPSQVPTQQGTALGIHRVRFRTIGPDVVGFIQPAHDPSLRLVLNGWMSSASSTCLAKSDPRPVQDALIPGCMPSLDNDCRVYNKSLRTQLPRSGAWIIDEENTGAPGRGVFLDVQDDQVIVQTSDYLPSGEPTFHLGAQRLRGTAESPYISKASTPLFRYAGGRYFGGQAQSGKEVANDGTAQIEFTPSTDLPWERNVNGTITLPGEGPKAMRRLPFEAATSGMEHMLGEYLIRWTTFETQKYHWVHLTRVQDIFAMNDDGTVQCYRDPWVKDLYWMRCAWLPSPNIHQNWLRSASVSTDVFNRYPKDDAPDMKTRDRHGNWLGLGTVNLPGLSIDNDQ